MPWPNFGGVVFRYEHQHVLRTSKILLLKIFCQIDTPKPRPFILVVEDSNACCAKVASDVRNVTAIFPGEAQRDVIFFSFVGLSHVGGHYGTANPAAMRRYGVGGLIGVQMPITRYLLYAHRNGGFPPLFKTAWLGW